MGDNQLKKHNVYGIDIVSKSHKSLINSKASLKKIAVVKTKKYNTERVSSEK